MSFIAGLLFGIIIGFLIATTILILIIRRN